MSEEALRIRRVAPNSFVVELPGEDHTMGNLLALTLQGLQGVKLAYYEQVHPLQRLVRVYVTLEGGYDIKDVLREALFKIRELNDEFRAQLAEALRQRGVELES